MALLGPTATLAAPCALAICGVCCQLSRPRVDNNTPSNISRVFTPPAAFTADTWAPPEPKMGEEVLPQRENMLEKGEMESLDSKQGDFISSRAGGPGTAALQLGRYLWSIVRPSFLNRSSKKPVKLRRTAYLDGLKGFASFLVYWLHHQLWAHMSQGAPYKMQHGWGYDGEYYLSAFFGIRTFFTGGHYSVATFFVISGYVLSAKPLSLLRAGDHPRIVESIGSSLFRRWLRLFMPIIATTFVTLCLWHVFGIWMDFVPEQTFRDEVWRWYTEFKNFSFIFNTGGFPWSTYNPHTWSIPVEFKGSIAIYTSFLAFSKMRTNMRLFCNAFLIFYFMYIADGAHFALFASGMLICDIEMLGAEGKLPTWLTQFQPYEKPIFTCLLIISIYLGGVPSFSNDVLMLRNTPGWYYLSFLPPQAVYDYKWFFLFWAAVLLVISIPHLPWLKRFFESRFCQYLGRTCYMFYLVHGPILWTLGDRLYAAVGLARDYHAMSIPGWVNRFQLPSIGPFGLELNFLLVHIILVPFTFWVAEISTTLIDDPSIRFTQWLYKKMLPAPSSPS